jgi:hypothetical protein
VELVDLETLVEPEVWEELETLVVQEMLVTQETLEELEAQHSQFHLLQVLLQL